VERLLKKHKKTMSHIFYSYAKSKRMTDNSWDEQIVNNIKVKKIHFIKQDTEKFPGLQFGVDQATEYADSKNWPIKTWDAAIDLEIYTREVVKKEQPPRNIAY